MDETPKYGKLTDTRVIDVHGSTLKEATNYRGGTTNYPIRRDYEYRHPCDKTDLATIAKVVQNLVSDDGKLDAYIRFETRTARDGKKSYYLVECYTKLVY